MTKKQQALAPGRYYVYGRKSYPQPLTFVQEIDLQANEALEEKLQATLRDPEWVELVAIPKAATIPLMQGGKF
ncbi:MAG: hypothetical protein D6814_09255 [Calditrichaeota bacterium]|nr:MAG: hypothetical protein D6814_09255 [Calditrichota bacterium]